MQYTITTANGKSIALDGKGKGRAAELLDEPVDFAAQTVEVTETEAFDHESVGLGNDRKDFDLTNFQAIDKWEPVELGTSSGRSSDISNIGFDVDLNGSEFDDWFPTADKPQDEQKVEDDYAWGVFHTESSPSKWTVDDLAADASTTGPTSGPGDTLTGNLFKEEDAMDTTPDPQPAANLEDEDTAVQWAIFASKQRNDTTTASNSAERYDSLTDGEYWWRRNAFIHWHENDNIQLYDWEGVKLFYRKQGWHVYGDEETAPILIPADTYIPDAEDEETDEELKRAMALSMQAAEEDEERTTTPRTPTLILRGAHSTAEKEQPTTRTATHNPMFQADANAPIDPAFLAALPWDIRQEILAEQERTWFASELQSYDMEEATPTPVKPQTGQQATIPIADALSELNKALPSLSSWADEEEEVRPANTVKPTNIFSAASGSSASKPLNPAANPFVVRPQTNDTPAKPAHSAPFPTLPPGFFSSQVKKPIDQASRQSIDDYFEDEDAADVETDIEIPDSITTGLNAYIRPSRQARKRFNQRQRKEKKKQKLKDTEIEILEPDRMITSWSRCGHCAFEGADEDVPWHVEQKHPETLATCPMCWRFRGTEEAVQTHMEEVHFG